MSIHDLHYSNPQQAKHPKVRWLVIEHLLQQILSQSVKVNDNLPATSDLCSSLGVSRTVVREAISVLVSKGMVVSKPGEGSRVQPLSSWMLLDPEVLYWLRESDMATGKDLRTSESTQGDIDFHNIILESSGNIFLSRMRDLCMVSVELIVRLTFEKVVSVAATIDNHTRLYETIRARQPDLARQEARRVLGKTVYDLQDLNILFRRDLLEHLSSGSEE